jgi:DNA repair protein RadA/Sms
MANVKTKFFCQDCGHESLKWLGRCPGCNSWNSFVEEVVKKNKEVKFRQEYNIGKPISINEISIENEKRVNTNIFELNRVLGGGIVLGSLVLVGGDPGIGKSTLLLQVANGVASLDNTVLYVSGEESQKQIRMRAERLNAINPNLYILSETNLDIIEKYIDEINPTLVIIDSIQTIYLEEVSSAPGSVSQVREGTGRLIRLAKGKNIPIFIVGHVTKEGSIAGPKILEHMVDTVLYFEGERNHTFRILRSVKNRFGSTNEIGVFEMAELGLQQVSNASKLLLAQRPKGVAGSVVMAAMEGTRPVLAELQALVSTSAYGTPRRTTAGVDYNRLALILAVLEKRIGLRLGNQDVYLNLVGGIKIDEPAIDLALAIAVASSYKDKSISEKLMVIGEVGLTGEVRGINQISSRISEGIKLGFNKCILPVYNVKQCIKFKDEIELIGVDSIIEALDVAMGG